MWLVAVAAVYPILAPFGLLAPRITDLPLALRALILRWFFVTLMACGVMPLVTRLLAGWLAGGQLIPERRRTGIEPASQLSPAHRF